MPLYLSVGGGARVEMLRHADHAAARDLIAELAGGGVEYDTWAYLPKPQTDLLDHLNGLGLLELHLRSGSRVIARLVGLSKQFRLSATRIDAGTGSWSRFAICRREEHGFIFESPLSCGVVLVQDPAFLAVMANPNCDVDTGELLVQAGVLDCRESDNHRLASWEFHDLYFHTRSRTGRSGARVGATYRLRGLLDPEPALRPRSGGKRIPLTKPLSHPASTPVLDSLKARHSRRVFGDTPIRLDQLSDFLYHACRVCQVTGEGESQLAKRPYPCSGAAYELEVYLVVQACDGLDRGLYYYDPLAHELCAVCEANVHCERLLEFASAAAGRKSAPQVLLIYAARFGRLTWKYESIAYAAILKDVGVLMQTMYLVAEGLGLAGCAIGAGDSDEFARATGTDYYVEGSVGEFLLGSRAGDEA